MLIENKKQEVTKSLHLQKTNKQTKKVIQIVLYEVILINVARSSVFVANEWKSRNSSSFFFGLKSIQLIIHGDSTSAGLT